jgi:Heparinase II/III-like protein
MVDAGPQGVGRSGHGHADALSVRLTIDGHRYLVDPGTCVYISDNEDRNLFRGTGGHNTLRVDACDQAVPAGPFAWTDIPKVKTERWVSGDSFDFLVASHDGYSRFADPVLHRRFVFRGEDGLWFIRDVAEGQGKHVLEIFWHFAGDLQVTEQENAVVATVAQSQANGGRAEYHTQAAILTPRNSAFLKELGSGLVSPAYGKTVAASALRVSAEVGLPAECAVLLIAQSQARKVGELVEINASQSRGLRAYQYEAADLVHCFFFYSATGTWTLAPWTSDAKFLYCRIEHGRLLHLVMLGGSFATWGDKTLVSQPHQVEKFEWSDRVGSLRASSDAILDQKREGDIESFDRVL